jgi:hypothetical protein
LTQERGRGTVCGVLSARKTFDELKSTNASDAEWKAWLNTASLNELRDVMAVLDKHVPYYDFADKAFHVRLSESQKESHWTVTPGFIVGCLAMIFGFVAMIFAGIAAWPIAKDWILPAPAAQKAGNAQLPKQDSPALTSPENTEGQRIFNSSGLHAPSQIPQPKQTLIQMPTNKPQESNTSSSTPIAPSKP